MIRTHGWSPFLAGGQGAVPSWGENRALPAGSSYLGCTHSVQRVGAHHSNV